MRLNVDLDRVFLQKQSQDVIANLSGGRSIIETVYSIKYKVGGKLPISIGTIGTWTVPGGAKYLAGIDINWIARNNGIGTYLLKKYFSGYYILAGNQRVVSLYERLAKKRFNELSKKELKELSEIIMYYNGYGTFKLR